MKDKKIFLIIFFTLMLLLIISIIISLAIYLNIEKLNTTEKDINIRTIESKNCNYKPELYYQKRDYNIYTYCLDNIIIVEDYRMELKEYIYNDKDIFDKLFKKLSSSTFYDGGTKEYKDYRTPNITNNGITIIKCNGRDGNTKDIYIGPDSMYFKENFCRKDNSTFVKSFKILNIEEKSLHNIILTLENSGNIDTVLIKTSYNFEIGKSYDFEFLGNEENVENNIKSLFEKTIVEIRKK